MKTIDLKFILITLFGAFSICLSSQAIKIGQYMIDHHSYSVSKLGQGENEQLFIKEKYESSSRKGSKSSKWTYAFVKPSSKGAIKNAFVKVLGMKRIKELMPEKYVTLSIYVDTNGKVLAVNYYLYKDSKIRLKEINALTSLIKRNVSFRIPSNIKKGSKLLPYTYVVKFSHFLN